MTAVRATPAPSVPLLDAAAARQGDEAAVAGGATWQGLMEQAAGHLARGVVALAGRAYGLRVAILVGKGNNGGDGWAAARRLARLGGCSWVIAPHGTDVDTTSEAGENRDRFLHRGGRVGDLSELDAALAWCDVAVDALLGTGISGSPRDPIAPATAALLAAHDRGVPIVACDIPSGVSSDDGSAPEGAVRADLTVTFGGVKRGLVLHPGAAHAGRVVVGDLGPGYAPPDVSWAALTAAGAAPPVLAPAADKRTRGRVLVVAGSTHMPGATVLTAQGAAAGGAGLVTVAATAAARAAVTAQVPEAMTLPLPDDGGWIATDAAGAVREAAHDSDVVVAGPGLGHGEGAAAVVSAIRRGARRAVLDADALNVHRDDPAALGQHDGDLVLTPHERELARIGGGTDGADAWANRTQRVPELAARYGATIVAKGPGTLVAAPDGRVWVTPTGGPALGAGGTGDVLAGVIAAAIATADDVPLAVARACWWHGLAGELAGARAAQRPSSSAILASVPAALARTAELACNDPGWPLEGRRR
ncbi:MAG: NAD(P)H-hydrate dehydratase [Actinobacteria bacterium]|nr:NAD(P)H-hydrate dehydratase [Actinomycetota bacterium]